MTPERIMPDGTGQLPDNPTNTGAGPEPQAQGGSSSSEMIAENPKEKGRSPRQPKRNPSRLKPPREDDGNKEEQLLQSVEPGDTEEDRVVPEVEGDLPHPFEDFLSNSPEEVRMQRLEAAEDLMDHTKSAGQLFDAAKKMGVPPDEIERMLRAAGHTDEEKIAEVVARKDELAPDASQVNLEPPTEEQQTRRELVEEFVKDAKDLQELAQTGADVSEAKAALEVKARGWLANWRDENPGTWNQINRGIVRPGVIVLLLVGLFYLMCVSGVTAGAARKVGK